MAKTRKAAQIIEEQILDWKHRHSTTSSRAPKKYKYPIITISREFGAKGAVFASYLARKIGFKVWDKELLQAITNEVGGGLKTVEMVDERRRKPVHDTVSGYFHNIPTNITYMRSLNRVVDSIEEFGNSIIVGRGANYICKNPKALHIRIVSPLKARIENYSKIEKVSFVDAKKIIETKDRERREFINLNFHRDINDASDYDLVINANSFTMDELAAIVIETYEKKAGVNVKVYD